MIPSSTHSQTGDNSGPSAGQDSSAVVDDHHPVPPPDRQDPPTAAALFGLTTDEAERRLKTEGANAIADVRQRPLWMAARKLWAPVPWMLEVAIVLQLALKDYVGASIVLLLFNAGLGLFQESQAQATVDALRSRLALLAAVRRDGKWQTLPAAGLVMNDIVKLSLGTVVPADVDLIDGSVLLDQSMLTGESVATESGAGAHAFAGALVRRGEARARVVATGERTKFGRTAELVRTASAESSQQKTVLRVVRNLVLFNGAVTRFARRVFVLGLHADRRDGAAPSGRDPIVDSCGLTVDVHLGRGCGRPVSREPGRSVDAPLGSRRSSRDRRPLLR